MKLLYKPDADYMYDRDANSAIRKRKRFEYIIDAGIEYYSLDLHHAVLGFC